MKKFIARALAVILVFCLLGTASILREKQSESLEQIEKCCLEKCTKEKAGIFAGEEKKLVFRQKTGLFSLPF
ncbi:MAG: hypothetical protein PHD95_05420 [Candidatus ainarchaeum sp.]|nr:hypothetical protein [Candidatus ainarchaeum sp.]